MSGENAWPESNNPPPKPAADTGPTVAPAIWLCFAVRAESAFLPENLPAKIILTGVGPHNAERALLAALRQDRPNLILTCGFAGGLNPSLPVGAVLFSADDGFLWLPQLTQSGAAPARFHFSSQIIHSAREKRNLHLATGTDAVEMESGCIRHLCRSHGIACATLRAISDPADQDLPLDFSRIMTLSGRLHWGRFMLALARHPGCLPGLLRLGKQSRLAARQLAATLRVFLTTLTSGQSQGGAASA